MYFLPGIGKGPTEQTQNFNSKNCAYSVPNEKLMDSFHTKTGRF